MADNSDLFKGIIPKDQMCMTQDLWADLVPKDTISGGDAGLAGRSGLNITEGVASKRRAILEEVNG